MIDSETDEMSGDIQPLIQEKAKAHQQQPQPPIQEMFIMREYMPAELIDIAAKFQQKARENIQAWYVQLRDTGNNGISLTGKEAGKMSNITYSALQ